MKKVLATVLALVMALALCSVSWAANPASVSNAEELKTAIGAATAENNTITLTENIDLSESVTINKSGVNLVIDLGGKKISGSSQLFDIYSPVTFKNGTIDVTYNGSASICVMWLNGGAKLALENDVIVNAAKSAGATGSVFAVGFWSDCDRAELTINGKITGDNGATINGTITTNTNKVTVNGTIDVAGHALYLAGNGITDINYGACVKGDAGIEFRAGVLNINGGTVESTGTYSVPSANGNGTTASGAALIVAEHTTNQGITVNVNSGNIKAASAGKAIAVSDPQSTGGNDVKLNVAGGNVVGGIQVEESIETAKPVAVTGGTFSSDVSAYTADNTPVAFTFNEGTSNNRTYYVGAGTIQNVANNLSAGQQLWIVKGTVTLMGVPAGVTVYPEHDTVVSVNGKDISNEFDGYTVPQSSGYYYYQPTTDTKTTDTKGSPKTFDAGIALYVGMALTSAAGVAFVGKKRED